MKNLKLAFLTVASMLLVASTAFSSGFYIKSKKGSQVGTQINVELELWNGGTITNFLSDVTIRYYFKSTDAHKYTGDVWYYDATGPKPGIRCSPVNNPYGSNHFCDIIFSKDAPGVAAKHAVSLELVFYGEPRKAETMSDDYSNPDSSYNFYKTDKIVVYENSKLVWGVEPVRNPHFFKIESYDPSGQNNDIRSVIHLIKDHRGLVSTNRMRIRYYFDTTYGTPSSYWSYINSDNAPGGTPQIECKGMEVPITNRADNADMYCDITFPNGGTMSSSYPEFYIDFVASNGTYQWKTADWSWVGSTRIENKRIVGFIDGELTWGELPK